MDPRDEWICLASVEGVGEGRLARLKCGTATYERGIGRGVMRRAEGSLAPEAAFQQPSVEQAGDALDDGHLECLVVIERRQQPRNRPGQQRLARSGWPNEQQVVAAAQSDLKRPACLVLTAYLGQIDWREVCCQRGAGSRRGSGAGPGPAELHGRSPHGATCRTATWAGDQPRGIIEPLHPMRLHPADEARLELVRGGHDHPAVAPAGKRSDHRQHSRHRLYRACQ